MEHNDICKKAETYVAALFSATDTSKLTYHNLEHTRKVNAYAHEISEHYKPDRE